MPAEIKDLLPPENSVRVLNSGPIIFHHRHIRAGYGRSRRCSVCSGNVDAIIEVAAAEVEQSVVRESAGVDEEGATPPASDGWWDR